MGEYICEWYDEEGVTIQIFFFKFYFIFKLYIIVLVLPYNNFKIIHSFVLRVGETERTA